MSTRAIEHCDLQLSDEDKNLLQYAAQLSGVSLACFIRQVALREAEKVIGREKVVNLKGLPKIIRDRNFRSLYFNG